MSFTISKLILRIKGTTLKALLSSLLHEHSIQCCHSGDATPKTSTTTCTAARADAMTCRCDRHLANTCAQRRSRPDATHTCHKLAIVASTCILYAGVFGTNLSASCARAHERVTMSEWLPGAGVYSTFQCCTQFTHVLATSFTGGSTSLNVYKYIYNHVTWKGTRFRSEREIVRVLYAGILFSIDWHTKRTLC